MASENPVRRETQISVQPCGLQSNQCNTKDGSWHLERVTVQLLKENDLSNVLVPQELERRILNQLVLVTGEKKAVKYL